MRDEVRAKDGALPATRLEKIIAAIWEDLLGVTGITTADDFFELGGHSLLAAQAVIRLEEELGGGPLPVRLVIESPTIAELSRAVERA